MARKLRLEYAGACYHVINRGNYRRDLFAVPGAAESFERCLFEAAARFGWRLHAYVIMQNHFHLAVETPEPNLSEGMRWLQATWAARFNRFRGESGRPFQGRYKALHVEKGQALGQVVNYIHLNPVRAKVVAVERLGEHRWSSLHHFGQPSRPGFLVAETVLAESGSRPDTAGGWKAYMDYLGVLAGEDSKRRRARFGRLSRGWMVGSEEFRAKLSNDLQGLGGTASRFELLGGNPAALREARSAQWEAVLRSAAEALHVDLGQLPARHSAPDKVALASLLKQTTSVSNRWLAVRLDMGQPASVSQYTRRFRLAGGPETPAYQQALSRIKR